jgi:hypothetical protein
MSDGKPLEDAVVQLFELCNIYYLRITNYRCFKCGQVQNSKAKGFPDFHAPSLSLYVECKMGKGKLSDKQKDVRAAILSDKSNTFIELRDNTDTLLHFLEQRGYISL